MAKYEDGCYGSLAGVSLIAKVLAGRCKMHYTRVAAGKGVMSDDESPKTMTEPADYVMDAKIAGITNPVDGECQITVQINSADVETGFYCTGLLLYAEDPDLGEVPFTYLVLENEPEWIRPASSIVGKLATFDIIAAVGDVDSVSAAIDPEAIASIAEVQQLISEHNTDPNAHAEQIAAAVAAEIKQMEEAGGVVSEDDVKNLIAEYGGGGIAKEIVFAVKPSDWKEGEGTYPYYADITDADVQEAHRPDVVLDEVSTDIASVYRVCAAARSYEGYVRLRAKEPPEQEISGALYLTGKGGSGGGGGYILPTATPTRLGGIKTGAGLTSKEDGETSVDLDAIAESVTGDVTQNVKEEAIARDSEFDEMMKEVYNSGSN